MVKKRIAAYCRVLDSLIAGALAVMVVLVFGNVLLRYIFNSGITVSEELSRWLFVWMTFLGAVSALKDHGHLGTDMLVGTQALSMAALAVSVWPADRATSYTPPALILASLMTSPTKLLAVMVSRMAAMPK